MTLVAVKEKRCHFKNRDKISEEDLVIAILCFSYTHKHFIVTVTVFYVPVNFPAAPQKF